MLPPTATPIRTARSSAIFNLISVQSNSRRCPDTVPAEMGNESGTNENRPQAYKAHSGLRAFRLCCVIDM
jgi:hypothetical protein